MFPTQNDIAMSKFSPLQEVELRCTVTGIPVPDISFKFGEEELPPDTQDLVMDNSEDNSEDNTTSHTRVASVAAARAGDYTCLAVNMYGSDRGHVTVGSRMMIMIVMIVMMVI